MLELLKKILGFNNTEFDDVLNSHISACIKDLEQLGIAPSFLYNEEEIVTITDDLIKMAVVTYVKSKVYDDEKLSKAYDIQRDELRKRTYYQVKNV